MKALSELEDQVKLKLTPLVEIFPKRFEPKIQKLGEKRIKILLRVSNVVNIMAKEILQYWGKSPFFLDFIHCNTNIKANGKHPLIMFSDLSKDIGISPIPIVGLNRSQEYISACKYAVEKLGNGLCLRIHSSDIESTDFNVQLNTMLTYFDLKANNIDIIFDNQLITEDSQKLSHVYKKLSPIGNWRTITLLGGIFPLDLTKFPKGTNTFDRQDYSFWLHQKDEVKPDRIPTFGDYTIQHPFLNNNLPEVPNPSASIRYTSSQHWIIMRGEALHKENGRGHSQYPAHAEMLYGHDEYSGENFSKGDAYIAMKRMTLNTKGTGSVETWLQAAINHHLTFVVRQLASLFDS
jgi:hypothetical protein